MFFLLNKGCWGRGMERKTGIRNQHKKKGSHARSDSCISIPALWLFASADPGTVAPGLLPSEFQMLT